MFSLSGQSNSTLPMRSSPYEYETTDAFPSSYGVGPNRFQYCGYCGCYHQGICSRIKSIEYYPNGTMKKIEYHAPQYFVNLT